MTPAPPIQRGLLIAAAVGGFTGVLAGTFGAHGLKGRIADDLLNSFEVGVRYHLIHAVALLVVAVLAGLLPQSRAMRAAGWCMSIGIVIFAGSLYALALSGEKWLGAVTPFGGVALLAGWGLLGLGGLRRVGS